MDPALDLLLRWFLATVLAAAAVHKLRDRSRFRAALDGYVVVPTRLVAALAVAVPLVELATAGALVLPPALDPTATVDSGFRWNDGEAVVTPAEAGVHSRWTAQRVGPLGAMALFLVYGVAITINLRRGRRDVDCGCSGWGAGAGLSWSLVARNAVLAGLALAVAAGGGSPRSLAWVDFVTVFFGAATLVGLYEAIDRMIAMSAAYGVARRMA